MNIEGQRLTSILKKADKPFEDSENPDPDAPIPEGDYEAFLHSFSFKEGRGGIPRIILTFSVANPGDHNGRFLFISHTFDPAYIGWLKATLFKMGLRPEPLPSELPEVLPTLIGERYRIEVVHKDGYVNAYMRGPANKQTASRRDRADKGGNSPRDPEPPSYGPGQTDSDLDEDIPF